MQRVDLHAFTVGNAAKAVLADALNDRRLAKLRPSLFDGSLPVAAQKYESEVSPDLLLIETQDAAPSIFQQLDQLSEVCRPGTDLILLGQQNDVSLYRQLAKRGVREYIPLPAEPDHLVDAMLTVCTRADEAKAGRLIACIGASGGAGSTTIANNVAWRLGKTFDGEVALLDLDLAFGTVGLDFNLESPQSSAHALAQADRLDDQMLERFLAKHNDNLALLTSPADCTSTGDIDIAALERVLKVVRRNAAWVVIDLPRIWGGWVRHVLDQADEIILTATPNLASLRNAKALADGLGGRAEGSHVRLVLNRVGANAKSEIAARDFGKTFGRPPSVVVPYDPALFAQAANLGQVVGEARKGQRVAEPFTKLATLVAGRQPPGLKRKAGGPRLFGKLFSLTL